MSGHGCSVDTALPEGFLRERLMETRGELTYHRQVGNQRAASSPQIIPGAFMHHIPSMSPPTFGSLIDLYRADPVDGMFSSFRISTSSSTTGFSNNNSNYFYSTASNICDKQNAWPSDAPPNDKEEYKKRSSSLKSTRTNGSNGTANGEKKIVRFADVLGLDLADVHTFLDEIPRIPKSAFKDLKNVDLSSLPPVNNRSCSSSRNDIKNLVPLFSQPAAQGCFTEKLSKNNISLENAFVSTSGSLSVKGTIKVLNINFEKQVIVRYTTDKWKNINEIHCTYVDGSSDGYSDRFSFNIPALNMQIGQRIEFALKYIVSEEEYWDNNGGANYCFQCIPEGPPKPVTSAYLPSSLASETWGSFY